MKYVSSDANVWIDFYEARSLSLPFRLPDTCFIMYEESISELKTPETLHDDLLSLGLQLVEMTDEELLFAATYSDMRLSGPDKVALSIAKLRGIPLLTGDRRLRQCAQRERIEVFGTLGLLDRLFEAEAINAQEYAGCLLLLQAANGRRVRLPEQELAERIKRICVMTGSG